MIDIFAPIDFFARFIVFDVFKLSEASKFSESLHFFIYDTIKISILVILISFISGVIKTYFAPEKTREFLSGKHTGLGNILAALLGIVTPFCSCSACPLFIGFIEAGIPLGITFSFLISAPMINEMALVLLFSLFGLKIAGIYLVSGLIIAIVGGFIIGTLKLEKYIEPFVFELKNKVKPSCACGCGEEKQTFKHRLIEGKNHSLGIYKSIWPYVLLGVAIGAWVHNYIPTELLLKYAGADNPFAVPLAVIIGIPIYAGCAGALPLAYVLVQSGMPMGTVLALTMSVTAISFPEFIILRKVLKPQMIAIFAGIMTLGIIFTGYLFNLIFKFI
ncbi:MAG TPA: hypothetical protein DDW90_00905 [Cyanobacteria bacterium UBA9971]|nr:hypothetical protein [Cyanobacteria bacterium UBA9971]